MHEDDRLSCVLCRRSEETKITGALATKDDVTAHQNCLLFSSALFCRNTPKFDDLFGFSVDDVLNEEKRGRLLICHKCKRRGATAGCEVGRCKKSYHYPCAVEERAMIVEDSEKEQYRLFCYNHYPKTKENNHSGNGCLSSSSKSKTYRNPEEPGTSKVHCLTCEKIEGNISSKSLPCGVVMSYCDKHAPGSHKRNASGDSTSNQRPSVYSSDLNSSSSRTLSSSKRRLTFKDKQDWTPSKRRAKVLSALLTDDSSNSDGDDEPDSEMAPLETDVEDSAMVHEPDIRKNRSYPRSTSETNLEDESGDESKDEDETIIHSDAESESLLHPVFLPLLATLAEASTQTTPELPPIEVQCKTEAQSLSLSLFTHDGNYPEQSPVHSEPDHHTTGPSVPQRKPVSPLPSAHTDAGDSACVNPPTSCSLPVAQSPEPSMDSSSFWRSCNAAGCTEAIFRGFNNEMSDISGRIQSEQASQEDFNLALTVMRASGKLSELVAKQQEELQVRQRELQKAAAAMEEAVSVLRR